MEHKETSNTWLIGVLVLFLASACATTPKTYGPAEEGGEPAPSVETVGPAPQTKRAVVVVLAGSGVRAFAGVGVLKELAARKVEVSGLVGTGLGGTLAILYAKSKSINEFEWMLTRLRDSMLEQTAEGRASFREYLQKTLGESDLSDLRKPVTLWVGSGQRGEPKAVEKGRASLWAEATTLRESTTPELRIDGDRIFEAGRRYPVGLAKQLSRGKVVVVDVRSEASEGGELQEADWVVRPDLSGVGDQDWSRRSSIVFRGSKAIREQGETLDQLRAP